MIWIGRAIPRLRARAAILDHDRGGRNADTEDHVGAGEGGAVMEGDPMAQLHLPGQWIEPLPARCVNSSSWPYGSKVSAGFAVAQRTTFSARAGATRQCREQRKGNENRPNGIYAHLPPINGTAPKLRHPGRLLQEHQPRQLESNARAQVTRPGRGPNCRCSITPPGRARGKRSGRAGSETQWQVRS